MNNALSGLHIWLFAGGLFVAYSALVMPFRPGFVAASARRAPLRRRDPRAVRHARLPLRASPTSSSSTSASGCSATTPPSGWSRPCSINVGLFLALTFVRIRVAHGGAAAWPRMLSDLAWSEVVDRARSRPGSSRCSFEPLEIGACESVAAGIGSVPKPKWPRPPNAQAASSSPRQGSTRGSSRSTESSALLLLVLVCGLAYQQIIKGAIHHEQERQQNERRIITPGPRGDILDRNGKLLVGNRARNAVVLYLDELRPEFSKEFIDIRKNYRDSGDKDLPTNDADGADRPRERS